MTKPADAVLSDEGIVRDDYALQRVPPNARYGWATVAVQRFGQVSSPDPVPARWDALGFGDGRSGARSGR